MSDSKEFKWDDSLVLEYIDNLLLSQLGRGMLNGVNDKMYAFKQSKQVAVPEYEIMAFVDHCTTNPDGSKRIVEWKDYYEHCTKEEWLKNWLVNDFKIHSVKRVSDSEVFSIDDEDKTYGKIIGFQFIQNDAFLYANCEQGEHTRFIAINYLEKAKPNQVLFTTEDGVEIHKNEKYFYVDSNWHVHTFTPKEGVKFNIVESRTFWHKEKLNEWLLENKPIMVSYKEIADLAPNHIKNQIFLVDTLKDFFKSKIRQ